MTLTLSVQHRPTAAAGSNTKCLSPANHGLQVYTENGMDASIRDESTQLNRVSDGTRNSN